MTYRHISKSSNKIAVKLSRVKSLMVVLLNLIKTINIMRDESYFSTYLCLARIV